MAYMVARTEKRKVGALAGYQIHVDRKTENHSNKDIDNSKTYLNYDLVGHDKKTSFKTEIMDYIESHKTSSRAVRKDAVVLQDWIIGSSQEFFDQLDDKETRKYFESAVEWFGEKFGQENIRFATVHMDESTPHMHLGIVPMKEGRLIAKTLFGRDTLRMVQEELPKHFQKRGFDIQRGLSNSEAQHVDPTLYKKTLDEAKKEAEEIKTLARTRADEILEFREKGATQELYEIWAEDWQETKKEYPDFEMREEVEFDEEDEIIDLQEKYGEKTVKIERGLGLEQGVISCYIKIDEDTPKTFELDFEAVSRLFREKMQQLSEYIRLKLREMRFKLSELRKEIKVQEEQKNANKSLLEGQSEQFKASVDSIIEPLGVHRRENEPVYFYNGYTKPELLGTLKEVIDGVEKDDYAFWDKISAQAAAKLYESDGEYYLRAYLEKELGRTEVNNAYLLLQESEEDLLEEPLNLYVNPSKSDLQRDNVKLYGIPQNTNLQDFTKESRIQELAEKTIKDNPAKAFGGMSL